MWDLTISVHVNEIDSEDFEDIRDSMLLSFKYLPDLMNFMSTVQEKSILNDDEGLEFTIIKQ